MHPLLFLLIACQGASPSAPAVTMETPPAKPVAEDSDVMRARDAAKALGMGVRGKLTEALATQGPAGSIAVCGEAAASVGASLAVDGVQVGRSSLRLRNPGNTGSDWVQAWLLAQGERPAADATPFVEKTLSSVRVALPVAVEAPCLACHGPVDSIAPEVRAALSQRYPADRATGYAVGDLRGAVWAEVQRSSSGG